MKRKLTSIFANSTKGFTLIELLVVLGILGILAVAILAAINPIEQLNKAQDAATENAATEFVNAVTAYYSVHSVPPFGPQAGGNGCTQNATFASVGLNTLKPCITALVKEGELKSSFSQINPITLKAVHIVSAKQNGTFIFSGCFKPQSHAVQNDPNTKYSVGTTVAANCNTAGTCYWCAQ